LADAAKESCALVVGTYSFPDLKFEKHNWRLPPGTDGVLGEDFIRSFKRVTIDLRSQKLYLETYPNGKLNNSECILNSGRSELYKGLLNQAMDRFNGLIDTNRADYRTFWLRGQCQHDKNDAVRDFTTSIKLCDDFAVAYSGRGRCYAEKHEYAKALDDLTMAIKIYTADPAAKRSDYGWDAQPYIWRGWVYELINKPQQAVDDYTTALSINPKSSFAHQERAWLLDQFGQHDLAAVDRQEAAKLDKQNNPSKGH
jgi:tetratricopeptide (TPR) repeat protein